MKLFFYLIIALNFLISFVEASPTCNHLATYNDIGDVNEIEIQPGENIPFNGSTIIGGSSISHPLIDTFLITSPGIYYLNVTLNTDQDSPLFGTVQTFINDQPIGITSQLALPGSNLILQTFISITTLPALLNIRVVSDESIILDDGIDAHISIIKVN